MLSMVSRTTCVLLTYEPSVQRTNTTNTMKPSCHWLQFAFLLLLLQLLLHNNSLCPYHYVDASSNYDYLYINNITASTVYEWKSSKPDHFSPHPIDMNRGTLLGKRIVQIATGVFHTVARTEDGLVFTWGWTYHNDGTLKSQKYPVQVVIPCDDDDDDASGDDTPSEERNCVATYVEAGALHTVIIVNNRTLYSWGDNTKGQLGDNTTTIRYSPTRVQHSFRPIKVVAWGTFTMALDDRGKVYSWGDNEDLQLGTNQIYSMVTRPIQIDLLDSEFIVDISAGYFHAMAVNSNGVVFTWGRSDVGALGVGPIPFASQLPTPLNYTHCLLRGKRIVKVSAGVSHSMALDDQGIMYSWGDNTWGQLGTSERLVMNGTKYIQWSPVTVDYSGDLNGKHITHMSTGIAHTMALSDDGYLYLFGSNELSQIGVIGIPFSSSPMLLNNNSLTVAAIAAGGYYSVFLSSNGSVHSFGYNSFGQLGDGTTVTRATPVPVRTSPLREKLIIQVASSDTHSIAVTSDGQLFSWGDNTYGQLGDGSNVGKNFPVSVEMNGVLKGDQIVQVAVSPLFSVALSRDGQLFSWGDNNGKLGDGDLVHHYSPVPVYMNGVLLGKKVIQIAVGREHTIVLTEDMKLFSWGLNSRGQLGSGTYLLHLSPVPVKMTEDMKGVQIKQIVAGDAHTVVRTEKHCFAWGSNREGQLGIDRSVQQTNTPRLVNLDSEVPKLIYAAGSKTVIVTEGNRVFSFGYPSRNDSFSQGSIEILASTDVLNYLITDSSGVFAMNDTGHVTELNSTFGDSNHIVSSFFVSTTGMGTLLQVTCKEGHFGPRCNQYTCFGVMKEAPNVCLGQGSCISPDECVCNDKYQGKVCDIPVCYGYSQDDPDVCGGYGMCTFRSM